MIIDVARINRVLEVFGLLLVVHHWDGQGRRSLPRDRTRLQITTARAFEARIAPPTPPAMLAPPSPGGSTSPYRAGAPPSSGLRVRVGATGWRVGKRAD